MQPAEIKRFGGETAALAMLRKLFDRHKPADAMFAVGYFVLCPESGRTKTVVGELFRITDEGYKGAIAFAQSHNQRHNIYIKPGVIRKDYTGSAAAVRDGDIVAQNAFWIDCDTPEHFERYNSTEFPEPSFHVHTGETPSLRRQSYWLLDHTAKNMDAWRALSADITAHFGSDEAVINASTWMRWAGWNGHPKPSHAGRVLEPVTATPGSGAEVEFETLYGCFSGAASAAVKGTNIHSDPQVWDVDSGRLGRSDSDVVELLRATHRPGEWHVNMRSATATMVGRGYPDVVIHAMALAHGRVDAPPADPDVQKLIDGARAPEKGWEPKQSGFERAPDPGSVDADAGPGLHMAADWVADFTPPEYLIDGVLRRSFCYSLTAPTGTGKTAIALEMAICIAAGQPFAGHEVEQGGVVFMAGENPEDVKARLILMAERQGVDLAGLPLAFIDTRCDIQRDTAAIADQIERIMGGVKCVIVDTLAAYFPGDDENSNAQVIAFARTLRALCSSLPGAPAVIVPSHPTKSYDASNMVPRGGGGFLAEVDGNLALWPHGEAVKLHHSGKHRGPDFEPVFFEIVEATSQNIVDGKGRMIPTAFARTISERREEQLMSEANSAEDAVLLDMVSVHKCSFGARCKALGWVNPNGSPKKSKLERVYARLKEAGLVFKSRGHWLLTDAGRKEAEALRAARGDIDLDGDNG